MKAFLSAIVVSLMLASHALAQRGLDDIAYDGGTSVSLKGWQYPLVAGGALLFYVLSGWLVTKSGRFAPLTFIGIFVGIGLYSGKWGFAFSVMVGVAFSCLVYDMNK